MAPIADSGTTAGDNFPVAFEIAKRQHKSSDYGGIGAREETLEQCAAFGRPRCARMPYSSTRDIILAIVSYSNACRRNIEECAVFLL